VEQEVKVREQVKELKGYYTNLVIYAGISASSIIVWLLNGGGPFWPIWPIAGFVTAATIQGMRLGQLKILGDFFPFLHPDWEDKQIKSLLEPIAREAENHSANLQEYSSEFVHKAARKQEKIKKIAKPKNKKDSKPDNILQP
jgi:hypothetical protein